MIFNNKNISLKKYIPLMAIVAVALLFSFLTLRHLGQLPYRFMGFFLCLFSLFKWIDLQGFKEAFQKYDLIAMKYPKYSLIYPCIESGLGLMYLAMYFLNFTNLVTVIVMGINTLSIAYALKKKQSLTCACLGSVIKLPLSVVSLFESVTMMVMALIMLIF